MNFNCSEFGEFGVYSALGDSYYIEDSGSNYYSDRSENLSTCMFDIEEELFSNESSLDKFTFEMETFISENTFEFDEYIDGGDEEAQEEDEEDEEEIQENDIDKTNKNSHRLRVFCNKEIILNNLKPVKSPSLKSHIRCHEKSDNPELHVRCYRAIIKQRNNLRNISANPINYELVDGEDQIYKATYSPNKNTVKGLNLRELALLNCSHRHLHRRRA